MFNGSLFADSLLETSWAQRSRRSWTTLTSFGLQALLMLLLFLLPLVTPVALPFLKPLPTPISLAPFRNAPAPAVQHTYARTSATTNSTTPIFVQPGHIPTTISNAPDTSQESSVGPVGPYIPGAIGDRNGIPDAIANIGNRALPPAPAPVTRPIRISHMNPGDLIRRVQPAYPPLARQARVQGQVMLAAVISKEGTIENLHVMAGHPMLTGAAIDAVKQWRYRPYILNNEAVEVETEITVNFSLSGN